MALYIYASGCHVTIDLIPKTAIQLDIDYSNEAEDEYLGALSPFIIDLDINNNIARIVVEYQTIAVRLKESGGKIKE